MTRNRYNGRLESLNNFLRRRYCGSECTKAARLRPDKEWNPDGDRFLRVLSLGAGVQSSTVLMMSIAGELPRLDLAVFADTGWEPKRVYEHLEWLEAQAEAAGIPVVKVSAGNIRDDIASGRSFASMPFFTPSNGRPGRVRRQCTRDYKLIPIRRQIKNVVQQTKVRWVEQWIGISWDEVQRVRDSDVTFVRNRYPLVERRLTRADCLQWMEAKGFPQPPKSACVGCPYHSDAEWRAIRAAPDEWAEAVEFDRKIRHRAGRGEVFLHSSLRPLDEVYLSDSQLSLFGDDCFGMCGV